MKTRQAVTTDTIDHFSTIASRYNDLRTTDPEVVDFVTDVLPADGHLLAVDVGCGSGRYDIELLKQAGNRISLTCLDFTVEMLRALDRELQGQALGQYHTLRPRTAFRFATNVSIVSSPSMRSITSTCRPSSESPPGYSFSMGFS